MNTSTQKKIYVVIGFARSGTSVITRALKALGIDLGDAMQAVDAHSKWNPKGFWEDHELAYSIHAKVYALLGHKLRGIRLIDHDEEKLIPAKHEAIKLLNQRFAKTSHWGFKDPSTAKVIPFWQSIFMSQNIEDHYIIALRNPLASATSFAKLSKLDTEIGLILWLTHLIPSIDDTFGKKRIVVSYEQMLKDPRKQLLRIQSQLNITTKTENLEEYIQEFLDDTLHRNKFSDENLKHNPLLTVAPLCIEVYELLLNVAEDKITIESEAFANAWNNIKQEFAKIYPIYCYLDNALQRNTTLQLNIRNIEKSYLWKLFYPLRLIDDYFRKIRHKKRRKFRLNTAYE